MLASFFEEAVLNVIEVFTRISHGTVRNASGVWTFIASSFGIQAPKARCQNSLVHRIISKRPTVGFKRVWMRGVSEEHIRCDT